jgi:hypothetical protein
VFHVLMLGRRVRKPAAAPQMRPPACINHPARASMTSAAATADLVRSSLLYVTVNLGGGTHTCSSAGQRIVVEGWKGYLLCPDPAVLCAADAQFALPVGSATVVAGNVPTPPPAPSPTDTPTVPALPTAPTRPGGSPAPTRTTPVSVAPRSQPATRSPEAGLTPQTRTPLRVMADASSVPPSKLSAGTRQLTPACRGPWAALLIVFALATARADGLW